MYLGKYGIEGSLLLCTWESIGLGIPVAMYLDKKAKFMGDKSCYQSFTHSAIKNLIGINNKILSNVNDEIQQSNFNYR